MSITVRANPTRVSWSHFRPVGSIPDSSEEAQINPEMPPLQNLHPQRTPNGRFRLPSTTLTVGLNGHNTIVVRTANKTAELLQHEQGHFDLLVLVTRALAKDLESIESASMDDLGRQVKDAVARHDARAQQIDAEYDKQTEHSRNRTEQSKWDTAIAQALRSPQATVVVGMPL